MEDFFARAIFGDLFIGCINKGELAEIFKDVSLVNVSVSSILKKT